MRNNIKHDIETMQVLGVGVMVGKMKNQMEHEKDSMRTGFTWLYIGVYMQGPE